MQIDKLTYRSVRTRAALLPLTRPVVARVGEFREWPVILIDLETEEGITGTSYLEPYLANSVKYIRPAIHDLIDRRKGEVIAPATDFYTHRKMLNLIGLQGVATIAVSGIDMAAWDALSKAANMPLARLLGGSTDPIPAYNSNGLWLTPVDTLEQEAAELKGEGNFDALKLRIGREYLADDLRALEAVRKGAGSDVKLMCDFNQGQTIGEALSRCHALDDSGLYWFEEPIPYDQIPGYVQLARELKTPVQLGENFYGPRSLYEAVTARAGDYMMPDLMRIGGVTGWLHAASIAGSAGIPISSHLYPEFSAHLLAVTETAHWLEWQDWVNPILQEPFKLSDGTLAIPETAGVGIEWDELAVKKFEMDI